MNTYRVYFKDGFSQEVKAMTEWEAKWKATQNKPSDSVSRVVFVKVG